MNLPLLCEQLETITTGIIVILNSKWYGHLLMEDTRLPKKITSGHRMVGREEKDRNNHGRTKWRTS